MTWADTPLQTPPPSLFATDALLLLCVAAVAVNSFTPNSCGAVAEEINGNGGKAIAVPGDVGDADFCKSLVETTTKELGGVHVLVNNAGITRDGLIMRMKDEDWDSVINTNIQWKL